MNTFNSKLTGKEQKESGSNAFSRYDELESEEEEANSGEDRDADKLKRKSKLASGIKKGPQPGISKIPICDQIIQEDQNEQTKVSRANIVSPGISPESLIDLKDNSLNFTKQVQML